MYMAEEALEHADLVVKGEGEKDEVENLVDKPILLWYYHIE
jgi:hypothetical protein